MSLLSLPTNVHILAALAERPRSLTDLRRAAGSPPQTTMRGHLRTLTETGILTRTRRRDFPGALDFELTASGREFWAAAGVVESWLSASPDQPLQLGTPTAKSVVKALIEGWDTGIVRAIAARPLSLTALNSLITAVSYPSLERRLVAMRLAGQIVAAPSNGRGTPYTATDWLRRAIAPLGAAARWERLNAPDGAPPITRLDVESAFLLCVPLLNLPADLTGVCRLAVEVPSSQGKRLAGVLVTVRSGEIVACKAALQGHADAWASGSAGAWLEAVIEESSEGLESGGELQLARALVDGLHGALFTANAPPLP